jgi:Alkylmercury lyase
VGRHDCCASAPVHEESAVRETASTRGGPLVEILYFDGCPNHEPAVALVERVGHELGIEPQIRLVNVPDQEAAQRLRFLGSPTVRVDGRDVDPHEKEHDDFALSCRIFRTEAGIAGQPDERWVREALLRSKVKTETVQKAIEATGIAPEKLGKERAKRLNREERALYEWILKSFAAGAPPEPDTLADEASRLDIEVEPALAALAREDLVHHDPATSAILVAYPFSGRPTAHRVRIDGREEVFAMCAIDALGIAPMLALPVEIISRDPISGGDVLVRLDPGDGASWEPTEAVVLAGSACEGPSFEGCCEVLNFFSSAVNAERYLREHSTVRGLPISIPDAIEIGRLVFGDILKED